MKMSKKIGWALAFSALMAAVPMSASADRHDGARSNHGRWHGDIRSFHSHDMPRWRGGNWHHGTHDGHFGWWWVVGGLWYFYPQPIYPYPDPYTPPVTVIQQSMPATPQSQAQNWYYCESAKSYYPYVPSCPEGWKMVPATPPGVPAQ